MNKLKYTCVSLVFLMFGVMIFSESNPVLAAEEHAGNTAVTAVFLENDKPTDAREPENPSQKHPDIESDPNNKATENLGPLSLDVVPRKIDFGNEAVSMAEKEYFAKNTGLQYLQVSDNRTDLSGWQVFVQRSEFTAENASLSGSVLTIPKGVVRNSLNQPATEIDSNLIAESVNLVAGKEEEQLIFASPKQKDVGKAVSVSAWDASKVTLKIPALTSKSQKAYTAQLNWALVSAPEN